MNVDSKGIILKNQKKNQENSGHSPTAHHLLGLAQKHQVYIGLIVILVFGAYLRSYHINYPSIGYHNMKENEYLSMALHYFNDGFSLERKVFFYDDRNFNTYAQVPLVSYTAALVWKVIGVNVWSVRLQMILFSLGSIVLSFILTRQLSKDNTLSLLTALLMAILPISVFFGRNIQPEAPGLACLLLTFVLFNQWKETPSWKLSLLTGLAWTVTGFYKSSFVVPSIALLALIPYQELFVAMKSKNRLHDLIPWSGFLSILIFPIYIVSNLLLNPGHAGYASSRIKPFQSFDFEYWKTIDSIGYFIDNYTYLLSYIFLVGLLFILLVKSTFRVFMLLNLFSMIPFMIVFSDHVNQHSYYQMPYVYFFSFGVAYCMYVVFSKASSLLKVPSLSIIGPVIVLMYAYGDVKAAIDRQHNVQFLGLDLAGEYVKSQTNPSDKFFALGSAQNVAVCYFAERYCSNLSGSTEGIRNYEDKFNARFIYINARYINQAASWESWKYIVENYHLAHAGLHRIGNTLYLSQIVLEKGDRKLDMTLLNKIKPIFKRDYEKTTQKIPYYVIEPD